MLQKGKSILLIVFMLMLWLPLVQGLFSIFKDRTELKGAFVKPEKPPFELDSFMNMSFQKKWEEYENYSFGFRKFMVKFKNSFEYVLFKGIDDKSDVITGREGYLYSLGSAERTMRGRWYNGKEYNQNTISKIKFLKNGIEKHGGHFAVLIVPSKESILPEYLPESYDNATYEHSDYEDFVNGYKKDSIPFIDLCAYFRKLKPTTDQLFTKTGFHWSVYGASLAQDTLLNYCRSFLTEPMPSYIRKGVEWSDTARGADADFEEPMNLLFSLQQPKYLYPKIEMTDSTLNRHRPKVIIIGDSFFWQIKNLNHLMHIFSEDSRYWYYFKTSFPLSQEPPDEMKDVDVLKELETADFVFLVGSMGTMGEFPFGVADYYHEHVTDPEKFQAIKDEASKNTQTCYLKAANNKFIYADSSTKNILTANRDTPSDRAIFKLISLEDNNYAIRSFDDKYLSAELGHENEITATRKIASGWETFEIIRLAGNQIALKAANGKFVTIDAKSKQLYASGVSIGEQEKFQLIKDTAR